MTGFAHLGLEATSGGCSSATPRKCRSFSSRCRNRSPPRSRRTRKTPPQPARHLQQCRRTDPQLRRRRQQALSRCVHRCAGIRPSQHRRGDGRLFGRSRECARDRSRGAGNRRPRSSRPPTAPDSVRRSSRGSPALTDLDGSCRRAARRCRRTATQHRGHGRRAALCPHLDVERMSQARCATMPAETAAQHLGDHGRPPARRIHGKADEVTQGIRERIEELARLIDDKRGVLVDALGAKGQTLANEIGRRHRRDAQGDRVEGLCLHRHDDEPGEMARMINGASEIATAAVQQVAEGDAGDDVLGDRAVAPRRHLGRQRDAGSQQGPAQRHASRCSNACAKATSCCRKCSRAPMPTCRRSNRRW